MQMDELLSELLKDIVENPDEIDILIDEAQEGNSITYIIDSNPDDAALIIGRKGKTIKSLRNILSIMAVKEDKRVFLNVKHQKPREERVESFESSLDKKEEEVTEPKEEPTDTQDTLGF